MTGGPVSRRSNSRKFTEYQHELRSRHWPEVHAQLLTESKIFCGCSTRFGAAPTSIPARSAWPAGVLPVLNKKVVDFALRAALATHCTVTPTSRWARKNYFYPDLPKGYQISMYELPIAEHGYVEVAALRPGSGQAPEQAKKVRLTRIHMEEDAGKSIHDARPARAWLT